MLLLTLALQGEVPGGHSGLGYVLTLFTAGGVASVVIAFVAARLTRPKAEVAKGSPERAPVAQVAPVQPPAAR